MAQPKHKKSTLLHRLEVKTGKCEGCGIPSWTAYCDRCAPPRSDSVLRLRSYGDKDGGDVWSGKAKTLTNQTWGRDSGEDGSEGWEIVSDD